MLNNLYTLLVVGKQKAIVAFVLMLVGGLGFQVGGVDLLDATVGEVISALVAGVIGYASVWFKANSK